MNTSNASERAGSAQLLQGHLASICFCTVKGYRRALLQRYACLLFSSEVFLQPKLQKKSSFLYKIKGRARFKSKGLFFPGVTAWSNARLFLNQQPSSQEVLCVSITQRKFLLCAKPCLSAPKKPRLLQGRQVSQSLLRKVPRRSVRSVPHSA